MKQLRFLPLLLILSLLLSGTTLAAEEVTPNSPSLYASSAPMSQYAGLFTEAERYGAAPLNRAAAAVILARCANGENAYVGSVSSDVDPSAWYAAGVRWAVEHSVLSLGEDGLFHPDQGMNREELCLALSNWLDATGHSLYIINAWCSFSDAGEFSKPGRQAAALMQEAGVMIEDAGGFFYPGATVTVPQAEAIILRFLGALQSVIFPDLPVSTVPESAPVDPSWFDDACFIGHSQVVGMQTYFSLGRADYYAMVGFTAKDMLEFEYFQGPDSGYGKLDRILHNYQGHYKKVYIMLGINDCSIDDDRVEQFLTPMRELMDLVKETQPEATVYLISLAPVGRATPMNVIYNPENTLLYSQALKTLSREYAAEYLDIFRMMADEEGYFKDRFNSGDGIHFLPSGYADVEYFIRCHTVS